ncbi:MAG: tRNA lysidine(34) synthetase TilS [Patescibacteria group bacterium]
MEVKDQLISQMEGRYFPPRGTVLVVAVSGGVDSMVLLHLLMLLAAKWDWEVIVAHFNHQLRKSASRDAELVKVVAKSWGLSFVLGTVDVGKLAKAKKMTVEEAGRVARYAWLRKVALRYNATTIVTAHTADDQAETVVMNWLRGGLVRALAGMHDYEQGIWRPLLTTFKKDLYRFVRQYHIEFVEDKSNRDISYNRNLVRYKILPVLVQANPGIVQVILRNAGVFAQLEGWLDYQLRDIYKHIVCSGESGTVNFNEKKFRKQDVFVQNELLLLAITQLQGDRQDIKKVHLEESQLVLASPQKTVWKQLPNKLFLSRGCGKINISRHRPKFVNK